MAADPAYRPPRLDRYLLDGERVVFAVRRHWASVAAPVLAAVGASALALFADARLPRGASLIAQVLAVAAVAVVLWSVWRILEWRHDWLVATDKRLLLSTGLITQSTPMMPLARVTDMNYKRPPIGRLLGYGTFVMESAGQEQALSEIAWMPDPDHNYRILVREIFSVDSPGDEPAYAATEPDEWGRPQGDLRRGADQSPSGHGSDHASEHASDQSRAIRVRPGGATPPPEQQVYRSPDLTERERAADTGPIPRYPTDPD